MALTPFLADPFFTQLERAMDRAFDRAADRGISADLMPFDTQMRPWRSTAGNHPMDVHETDKAFEITADAPGFGPDNIKIELQDNVISISGEKQAENQEKDKEGRVVRQERHFMKFARSFTLPDNVKTDGITADLDKGVLKVVVPKTEPVKKPEPKRIQVKSS